MTDHRSAREIEKEIERERADLTNTLDDLQERFSLDTIVRQVGDQFREHGGDIGRSISRSVKDNPMALALTGVGVAWMIFGQPRNQSDNFDRDRGYDRFSGDRYREVRSGASRTGSRSSYGDRPYVGGETDDRGLDAGRGYGASSSLPDWARDDEEMYGDDGYSSRTYGSGLSSSSSGSIDETAYAEDDGTGGGSGSGSMRDRAGKAREAVSSAASSTRQSFADTKDGVAERARQARHRLSEGTERFSDEARARVMAARDQAVQARAAAKRYAREGSRRAGDLFEEQPLIAGALALAVGAAIGAALPRTKVEDEYLGAHSDRMMDEAERIYHEEKAKLEDVVSAATAEAKTVAGEMKSEAEKMKADADRSAPGGSAAQSVADKARDSAQRISDAAKDEAEKKGVGRINT